MAFLKQHLIMIILAAVCLGSAGTAVWAYLDGGNILQQMQDIDKLRNQVRGKHKAPNLTMIEARKKSAEEENAIMKARLETVLQKQKHNRFDGKPRQTLVPNVLPKLKSNAAAFAFKSEYQREFSKLLISLRARDKARAGDIHAQRALIENRSGGSDSSVPKNFWMPDAPPEEEKDESSSDEFPTLQKVLSENPEARAAELVARDCYMYVSKNAIKPHQLVHSNDAPKVEEIWQAQMALWIEQDIVSALASINTERASILQEKGIEPWVAHMPVKHLKILRLQNWFGKGGGMNAGGIASSFTSKKNDNKLFIIPIQMELVVEEASVLKVIDSLCSVGFYTPTRVQYSMVEPNPFQSEYIYGDDPVLMMTIDLEGYYFREVFDEWIPKSLKKILATPEAEELRSGRG